VTGDTGPTGRPRVRLCSQVAGSIVQNHGDQLYSGAATI